MHAPVSDGKTLHARYTFSYRSTPPEAKGPAMFEGVAILIPGSLVSLAPRNDGLNHLTAAQAGSPSACAAPVLRRWMSRSGLAGRTESTRRWRRRRWRDD